MSESTYELPDGWTTSPLSTVLKSLESGCRPKGGVRHITEGVPSIGGEHVRADGSINLTEPRFVPKDFAAKQKRGWIQPQDVLIVKDGATTGKTGFAPESLAEQTAMVNEHVFCCRTNKGVTPQFVYHFCRSMDGQTQILDNFRGAAQGGIIASFADNVRIPIAPLPEQRRIVAKIEALQSRSRKARESLETIPKLLEQFRQSVLAAAFRGDLTAAWREQHPDVEPATALLERIRAERRKKWEEAELAKLQAKGKAPKDDSWKDKYVEPEPVDDAELPELPEGWCWTSFDAITESFDHARIPLNQADRDKRSGAYPYYGASGIIDDIDDFLFDGDFLLIGEDGANLLARSTPIAFTAHGKFWVNNHAHVVQTVGGIDLQYLAAFINGISLQPFVSGSAQPKLTQKSLNRVPIAVAPLAEQAALLSIIHRALQVPEHLSDTALGLAVLLAELDQSLLSKAFRGELVPQDPSDEPASALLERIRAERASSGTVASGRGRRKRSDDQPVAADV